MGKKVRFFYRYLSAVFKKQWRKFGFVTVILALILLSFSFFAPFLTATFASFTAKTVKPVFREGIVGKPQTFNPLFSRLEVEKEINNLVFRGLTKVAPDGQIVPDLAESIEVKENNEYIFKLKEDTKWQDGQSFTADDVIYTIALAQDRRYDSVVAENFKDVEVSKIDDKTVSFKLKEAFAPFLTTTTIGIIPKHISLTDYRPVGTGEFRFVAIESESVTLENENIRLRFQFYPTEEDAILALKQGQVHALSVSREKLRELASWKNFQIEAPTLPYRLINLLYNTKIAPFNEKNVRQALTYSIDKSEVVKNNTGDKGKIAANSYALLDSQQAGTKEKYTFSLEKADQLLKSQGWELVDGKRMKDGKQFTVTITTLADKEYEDTATKIAANWQTLGIDVAVTAVSGNELKDQIVPSRDFNVLLTSQLLSSDQDQYVMWHTTQTAEGNVSGISSPKLDKLLEDARRTLDPKVRTEKYQEFSKHLLDESPAVFLYYPSYTWVYSNRVENVSFEEFREPVDRFKSAKNWVLKRPLI